MKRFVLCIALLSACSGSGGRHTTNPAAEDVMVVGEDLVLRREHDNTITAIATRVLGDTSGTGAVRLRTADLQLASTSPHLRFARARAFHVLASKLESTPAQSLEAATLGIDELGEHYSRPMVNDDTGVQLRALLAGRGDPQRLPAVAKRVREILQTRLRNYAMRWKDELR